MNRGDRIAIVQKVKAMSATGQAITYKPVQTRNGRVVPLDAEARARFQQLGSVVTHKLFFEAGVVLNLGEYRFRHSDKTYEPVQPPLYLDSATVIIVREI